MNDITEREQIQRQIDEVVTIMDKVYNEEDAINEVKKMTELVNDDIVHVHELRINEGILRSWYGYMIVFNGFIYSNQLSRDYFITLNDNFKSSFNYMLTTGEHNKMQQLSIKGYMDRDFTARLFMSNIVVMMARVHTIPESLRIEMVEYLVSRYLTKYDSPEYDKFIML